MYKMTEGMKQMKALGYATRIYIDDVTVRQFFKRNNDGYITDINFAYTIGKGLEVFSNAKYGIRVDKDLLNAIITNFNEIEKERNEENERNI